MKKILLFVLLFFIKVVTSYAITTFTSVSGGPYLSSGTWLQSGLPIDADGIPDANDNVIISPFHIVTVSVNSSSCNDITINGTLQFISNVVFIVKGNYTMSGSEAGVGTIRFDSGAGILTVTGTVASTAVYHFNSNLTISANSVINKYGSTTRITNGAMVTNLGNFTIGGVTTGTLSKWVNGTGSTLTIKTTGFFTSGIFDPSAVSNTVILNFNGSTVPKTLSGYNNLSTISSLKTLSENTIVSGDLTIASGATLTASSFILSLAGNWLNFGTFAQSTGTVVFNGSTAQSIGGTSTANFYKLTINSSNTVTLNTIATVSNLLTMTSGTFNTGTYTVTGGGSFLATGGDYQTSLLGTTVPGLTGAYSLMSGTMTFNGAGSQTIRGGIGYFNIVISGSGTKTAGGALDINGTATISSTLDVSASNYAVSFAGNLINNGSFTTRNGTVTFDGTSTISGSTITSFRNVTISGTLTGHATNINVAGNWINNGTYTHNSGGVTFNGTSTISGSASTSFRNITISGSLTGDATNMNVAGSWINNGTFTHNNGTVTFDGTSTISGSATTSFQNLTISGTLTGHSTNMNVAGNWTNNGTYTHNNGMVTFNGTSNISGFSITNFNAITISGIVTAPAFMNIAGNWVNNGTFTHNSGTVVFNGTTTIGGLTISSFQNITISGTLTGNVTNMNVAGSWINNGTFTHNNGTVSFNGTTTITGSSTTTFNNISISGTLTGHATTLNIFGDFINNGVYNSNGGLLVFNGSSAQAISGAGIGTFESLTLSNAAGLSINTGTYNLDGTLTITAGNLSNSGGVFTLVSDASRYARIASISAGCGTCSFSGNFVIQRYIPSRTIGTWADLSSPVANATMADWDNELFMVYPLGSYDPVTGRPKGTNVLAYDEVSAYYYELNSSTQLAAGQGFEIGLTDDATNTNFSTTTLTTTGTPNYGSFYIPLSYTGANGPPYPTGYSGENLIGNPYASAIALNLITKTNALSTVDVYDYVTDNYKTLSGTDIIGPYQGFWAYAQGSGAGFTIPESSKSSSTTTAINRVNASNEQPYLQVTLSSADGSHNMAHTLKIACDEKALDSWDNSDHPFRRSLNPKAPSITANAGNVVTSINTFNSNHENYIMPLTVQIGIEGKYNLNVSGITTIAKNFPVILLEDTKTKQFIDLNNSTDYSFSANTTDSKKRFVLHFSKSINYTPSKTIISKDEIVISQNSSGNTINFDFDHTQNASVSIVDVMGRSIVNNLNVQAYNQALTVSLPENFHGMYLIIVQSEQAKVVKKFVTP